MLQLFFLHKSEKNIVKPIEKTDMIYADFGYPHDMERFILYMSADDGYSINKVVEKTKKL